MTCIILNGAENLSVERPVRFGVKYSLLPSLICAFGLFFGGSNLAAQENPAQEIVSDSPIQKAALNTAAIVDLPDVAKVEVKTPVYQPNFEDFKMQLGTYRYTVRWEGIAAAELFLTVSQEGLRYKLEAKAKTYSGIDLFYKLRYDSVGIISALDFSPIKTSIDHKENSRRNLTEINFSETGKVRAERRNHKDEIQTLDFDPHNFMLDPFSAAFLARSQDWEVGTSRTFDVFNGKSRYLITLTSVREETVRINDQPRRVWVIEPSVKNLVDQTQAKKLRRAEIFVTADESRELLLIKSNVFIGTVTTRLESFSPANQPTVSITMVGLGRARNDG